MRNPPELPETLIPVFARFDTADREALLQARGLVFEVAANDTRIGGIEETTRWGEAAYLPKTSRVGSTVRLGLEKTTGCPAVFFTCNTTLVEGFRAQFGDDLRYSKNRAVLLDGSGAGFETKISTCIAQALTYHLTKV